MYSTIDSIYLRTLVVYYLWLYKSVKQNLCAANLIVSDSIHLAANAYIVLLATVQVYFSAQA